MKRRSLVLVLALLPLAGGCNEREVSPTDPGPPPVAAPTVVETFTGTLMQNGTSQHNITLANDGAIAIRIVEVGPLATLTLGLEVGTRAGGVCTVFGLDSSVVKGEQFLSDAVPAGNYCVRMVDVGNIFADKTVTYTVEVTHT